MKFIKNNPIKIPARNIEVGACFTFESAPSAPFIRAKVDEHTSEDIKHWVPVLNLTSGHLKYITPSTMVTPIDVELHQI